MDIKKPEMNIVHTCKLVTEIESEILMKISTTNIALLTQCHLRAAKLNLEAAKTIEKAYIKNTNHEQAEQSVKDDYMAHISCSIISSVAALESNINELFQYLKNQCDSEKKHKNNGKTYAEIVHDFTCEFYSEKDDNIFSIIASKPHRVISKYKALHFLKKQSPLEITEDESLNLEYIVQLRNKTIHFSPEFIESNNKESGKVNKKLHNIYKSRYKKTFTLNMFYPNHPHFIPYQCFSASCAAWCIENIESFIAKFNKNINNHTPAKISINPSSL